MTDEVRKALVQEKERMFLFVGGLFSGFCFGIFVTVLMFVSSDAP